MSQPQNQQSTNIASISPHIRQISHVLLSCSQKPKGGYDYADRFENTACPGMADAHDTKAHIQTHGRRSGFCTRDQRRLASRLRPVPADHRPRLKGAYASNVNRRRSADCRPAPRGDYDRPTGSSTGTYQRIH